MGKQSDMFGRTEDAILAERVMQTVIGPRIQGRFRDSKDIVNSSEVAEMFAGLDLVGQTVFREFRGPTHQCNSR
jgi:hypothetical protein